MANDGIQVEEGLTLEEVREIVETSGRAEDAAINRLGEQVAALADSVEQMRSCLQLSSKSSTIIVM